MRRKIIKLASILMFLAALLFIEPVVSTRAESLNQTDGIGFTGKWTAPKNSEGREKNSSEDSEEVDRNSPKSSSSNSNSSLPRTGDSNSEMGYSILGSSLLLFGAYVKRKNNYF